MAGFPLARPPAGDDPSTLELPQQFDPAAGPPNTLQIPQQFNPLARRPAVGPAYTFRQPPGPAATSFGNLPWRQGGVYGTLSHIESGQHNILSQVDRGSPEERSQGYFQIKSSTLKRYGRQAGIDPGTLTRAMDLSPAMQQRIVSQIPLREFGPRTQALMQQKYGGLFNPNMTVGQLASLLGEGTAYAEEPPGDATGGLPAPKGPFTTAPTTYMRGGPGAGGAGGPPQKSVDINMLRGMIAHLPQDRQQRIMDKALNINRQFAAKDTDKATKQRLLESGDIYPVGPAAQPAAPGQAAQTREDIEEDIRHPWYGYFRRPATAAVGSVIRPFTPVVGQRNLFGRMTGPGEGYTPQQERQLESWTGHTFAPQTPTQAALMAAAIPMGWLEMAPELAPEAEQGLTGLAKFRQFARPLASTLPRRMLTMGGVGAVAAPHFGEGTPWQGFKQGLAFQAPGEILSEVGGTLGRLGGRTALLNKTEADVAEAVGKNLPTKIGPGGPGTDRPFNLQDWKTPDKAFQDVQDMLKPERNMIQWDPRVRRMKFWAPIVKSGVDPAQYQWARMSLQNAEEQMTKLGELGYLKTGDWASKGYSRDARNMYGSLKESIAKQLPSDIRPRWERVRDWSGNASAYRRLFKAKQPEEQVINPNSGHINQPKLIQRLRKQWGDLQTQLGRKGVQELWDAAVRVKPLGPIRRRYYRGSPYKGASEDVPGHLLPRFYWGEGGGWRPHLSIIPETYKPIGNVPIWMYPPATPLAAGSSGYVGQKTGWGRQRPKRAKQPPP